VVNQLVVLLHAASINHHVTLCDGFNKHGRNSSRTPYENSWK